MRLVVSVAERVVVLNFGKVIESGTPAEDAASTGRHRGLSPGTTTDDDDDAERPSRRQPTQAD